MHDYYNRIDILHASSGMYASNGVTIYRYEIDKNRLRVQLSCKPDLIANTWQVECTKKGRGYVGTMKPAEFILHQWLMQQRAQDCYV